MSRWAELMNRLGYKRYVAQGGDWGNAITEVMALQQPAGLLAIHTNMSATLPEAIRNALPAGPAPARAAPAVGALEDPAAVPPFGRMWLAADWLSRRRRPRRG